MLDASGDRDREICDLLGRSSLPLVAISLDQDEGELKRVTKARKMTWPQYFDGRGWQNEIAQKYGIDGIPAMTAHRCVTLGGDLTLTREPGDPAMRLAGAVNTIRGNYDFQGRRFEILRDGSIRFEGLEQIALFP